MLQSGQINSVELCIFKRITGLPCPSCGSTRSVLFILQGNFDEAFSINPLGFAIIALMTILPIWLIADIVGKKKTLQYTYGKAERILSKPIVAIPCLMLLGAHWIWAIFNHI
ncbi:MAG: DUF2752 domain-containing protein [Saprospiraceae bacterium]